MRNRVLLFGLVVLATLPLQARADITYEYVAGQSNFTVAQGGQVTVNLYLQEILTNGSQSLIVQDGGMLSAAVQVNLASGTSATITGKGENTTSPWPAGAFAFGGDFFNSTTAKVGVNSGSNLGTANNVFPDANGRILIGTVTITASSTATGTTTYNLTGYEPAVGGNTATIGASPPSQAAASAFDLDYTNNQSPSTGGSPSGTYIGTLDPSVVPFETFSVTVTAVPEPGSMALCGLAVCGGAFAAYRRRKALAAEVQLA